ncbi:DNA-3-methyladenine glycosylase I [Lampropedia aestuarii]|uniref:DNA-3-methyladenine glycosylase I n=1 Tax=Lampropedia aestuarii TaxID=2562762 RepID=A0A4S5BTH6_9BURK|nr:DNA-3-methyladenine glycosylase I [Lampropedia aestuarii]THJ33238.1 DNA-3-methyladenine glycosylase I [Lampropedia aestuarii]
MTYTADPASSAPLQRCAWCESDAAMRDYHDHEWGFATLDDTALFEKLCLESFQSGLSWRTILNKRAGFRAAFADFDFAQIAQFTAADTERLLADAAIVRHRGKIEATLNNARRAQDIVAEYGSLAAFFWPFAPRTAKQDSTIPSVTAESTALSKALKQRGWAFFGPTTAYAFMQASGMVNDHAPHCHVHAQAEATRVQALAQQSWAAR